MRPSPEVPGYEVERLLGEGAFGRVWLAREREGLRRPVALKTFAAREAWQRELDVVRRVEEVRRAARCPHLVQSLGAGEGPDAAFIAYEWLEGGTLEERVLRGGPLPCAQAVGCAHEVGEALRLLHAAGVFHRDVKPGNLLLGADGVVRLADFGLSRPLGGTLSAAGSPAFAAPELIAGRAQDGRRLDVYSLGATLAWLLTGETMLPGRPDVFLLERHGVPRPLQRVLTRAMACEPEERLPTIEALLAELTRAQAAPLARPADPPPAPPSARARPPQAREDLERFAARLARLEALLEAGLISREDHAATAQRILGEALGDTSG